MVIYGQITIRNLRGCGWFWVVMGFCGYDAWRAYQDSNLNRSLRRQLLYPVEL